MTVIQATEGLKEQLAAAQDEIGRLHPQLAEAQQLSQSQQQQVTASSEDLVSSQKQVAQLHQQVAQLGQDNESLSTHNLQLREVLLEAYALPNQLEISEARLAVSQWQVTQLHEQVTQLHEQVTQLHEQVTQLHEQVTQLNEQVSQLQSQLHAVGTRHVDGWGRDVRLKKLREAAQHEAAMMRALDASLPSLAPPLKPSPALTKQPSQPQAQLHRTHSPLEQQRQEGVSMKLGLQEKVSAGNDETAALPAQLEEMQTAPPMKRTPLRQLPADVLTPKLLLHPVSNLKLQHVL